MEISLMSLAAGSLIIFLAFLIRSLTGFGSAMISIPLLAILFDLKFVVPLESVLEVGFTLLLISKVFPKIHGKTILPMIGGAILGTILGIHFLRTLPEEALKRALGVFIFLFGLYYFAREDQMTTTGNISNQWGILAGAAGGVLGGLFGTSGPPFVAYLAYRLKEKEAFRASLIGMFAVDYAWRTAVFAFTGLLTTQVFLFVLFLMPALILGTLVGQTIHIKISPGSFKKMVAAILLVSGVLLCR